MADSFSD